MIRFNNRKHAFTFIEIVLTIAMIGLVLTPIFTLEYKMNGIIARVTNRITRIFFLEEALVQARTKVLGNEKNAPEEKTIVEPATRISIASHKPTKNSSLSKVDDILVLKGKAQWAAVVGETEETIVTCVYKPEKKEST